LQNDFVNTFCEIKVEAGEVDLAAGVNLKIIDRVRKVMNYPANSEQIRQSRTNKTVNKAVEKNKTVKDLKPL